MAECNKFGKGFHRMCERIPDGIFMKQNLKINSLQKLFKLEVELYFSHYLFHKSKLYQSVRR